MSYTKTTWTDGTTPIDATNMNKIEDGIAANADGIDELNSNLSNINPIFNSASDMISFMQSLGDLSSCAFGAKGDTSNLLTNNNVDQGFVRGYGLARPSYFDYEISFPDRGYIFIGRYNYANEALTYLHRFSGTSVSISSTGEPVIMGDEEDAG